MGGVLCSQPQEQMVQGGFFDTSQSSNKMLMSYKDVEDSKMSSEYQLLIQAKNADKED